MWVSFERHCVEKEAVLLMWCVVTGCACVPEIHPGLSKPNCCKKGCFAESPRFLTAVEKMKARRLKRLVVLLLPGHAGQFHVPGLIPAQVLPAQSPRVSSTGFALWQSPLVLWVDGDKETPLPCSLNHPVNLLTAGTRLGLGAVRLTCHSCLPVGWLSGSVIEIIP